MSNLRLYPTNYLKPIHQEIGSTLHETWQSQLQSVPESVPTISKNASDEFANRIYKSIDLAG